MSNTTTAPVATALVCAISARDFGSKKEHRVSWTAGALRHVIAALNGAPVAVTTDGQTGSTEVGAVLVGIRPGGSGNSDRILISYQGQITAYLIFTLGEVIIPLADEMGRTGAKWVALESYRKEARAASFKAQREHGEGRQEGGRWETSLGADYVVVSYRPDERLPYLEQAKLRGFWEYPLDALEV